MSDELIEGRSLRGRRPLEPIQPEPPEDELLPLQRETPRPEAAPTQPPAQPSALPPIGEYPPGVIPKFVTTTGELQPITEETIEEIEQVLSAHARGETPEHYVPQFQAPTGEFQPLTLETFEQLVQLARQRSWRRVPPARRPRPAGAAQPGAAAYSPGGELPEDFIPWFDTVTGELPPIILTEEEEREIAQMHALEQAEEEREHRVEVEVRVQPPPSPALTHAPRPPHTEQHGGFGPITRQLLAAIRGETREDVGQADRPRRWEPRQVWMAVGAVALIALLVLALVIWSRIPALSISGGEPTTHGSVATEATLPPGIVPPGQTSAAPVATEAPAPTGALSPTALPFAQGRIAFASNRDGDFDIYVLDMATGIAVQVTDNDVEDRWPSWSPNGEQVVFVSDQSGDDDLFVMDARGANRTQLTTATSMDRYPAWSPDGRTVVFSRETASGSDLMSFNSACMAQAGACEDALTTVTTGRYDLHPAWSPDGSRIVFAASDFPGLPSVIALMMPGTTEYEPLPGTGSSDSSPAWSPDGNRIAFVSYARGDNDLYVMAANGAQVVQLTAETSNDVEPTWSPDGRYLVFASDRSGEGDFELYLIRTNCRSPEEGCEAEAIQLTDNTADDLNPAWIP